MKTRTLLFVTEDKERREWIHKNLYAIKYY